MRFLWSALSTSFVIASAVSAEFAIAAEDDIVVDSEDVANASIEAMSLQAVRDAEDRFSLYLDRIERECSLTADQKKKVQLAVKRDIRLLAQQLMDGSTPQFIAIRRFILVHAEQKMRLNVSPSYFIKEGTFVSKVLAKQLTSEQRRRFEALTEKEKQTSAFTLSR